MVCNLFHQGNRAVVVLVELVVVLVVDLRSKDLELVVVDLRSKDLEVLVEGVVVLVAVSYTHLTLPTILLV